MGSVVLFIGSVEGNETIQWEVWFFLKVQLRGMKLYSGKCGSF